VLQVRVRPLDANLGSTHDYCFAANSTSPFRTSGGTTNHVADAAPVHVNRRRPGDSDRRSQRDPIFSTRVLVSGLAAHTAISAPFTPDASAIAVSFSSAFDSVRFAC